MADRGGLPAHVLSGKGASCEVIGTVLAKALVTSGLRSSNVLALLWMMAVLGLAMRALRLSALLASNCIVFLGGYSTRLTTRCQRWEN